MSNNQRTTKLRGTEKSSSNSQANFNKEHAIEPGASVLLQPSISQSNKQSQYECGGRGMAIKKLEESLMATTNDISRNPAMNYSNTSIENHFKSLREENMKKIQAENEEKWGKMMHFDKTG